MRTFSVVSVLRVFGVLGLLFAPPALADYSNEGDAATVLGTKHRYHHSQPISVTPLIGGSAYLGRWNDNISNSYTLGLLVEFPVTSLISIEAEGGYSKYKMEYSRRLTGPRGPVAGVYAHDFDQFLLGVNSKFYLTRGTIKPYLGVGVLALHYANMDRGPLTPKYGQWMGAGQAIGGAEAEVTHGVHLGARVSWILPMIGVPQGDDQFAVARPNLEDATAMGKSFVRFGGTARISL